MTEEDYKQAETIAVEMVDWLFTKTNNSHLLLTVLMRSLCLFMARSLKKGASIDWVVKRFSKAFRQEMQDAIAFTEKEKGKA
jgi:hypothetical protein